MVNFENGKTPLSAENMNKLQNDLLKDIQEVDNKLVYSTKEQVVGTWVDGKNIYRKVINFVTGSTLNTWNNIGTLEAEKIIALYGGVEVEGVSLYPIPYSANTGSSVETVYFYFNIDAGILNERHSFEYMNNKSGYIIVEYTKSTD